MSPLGIVSFTSMVVWERPTVMILSRPQRIQLALRTRTAFCSFVLMYLLGAGCNPRPDVGEVIGNGGGGGEGGEMGEMGEMGETGQGSEGETGGASVFGSGRKGELHASSSFPGKVTVLAGSGSNIPITRKLVRVYVDEVTQANGPGDEPIVPKFIVPNSIGSVGGIKALVEGAVDAALISRPIRATEVEMGLVAQPYAVTTVCFIASGDVLQADLTLTSEEAFAILKGTVKWWKSSGREIVVVVREAGDSSNMVLERNWPGFRELLADMLEQKRWRVAYTDEEMVSTVESTPGAFGVADLGMVKSSEAMVQLVTVDGVGAEDVLVRRRGQSGDYPGDQVGGDAQNVKSGAGQPRFDKVLSFVTRGSMDSIKNMELAKFVEWVVKSPSAHSLLKANGYRPVEADAGMGRE